MLGCGIICPWKSRVLGVLSRSVTAASIQQERTMNPPGFGGGVVGFFPWRIDKNGALIFRRSSEPVYVTVKENLWPCSAGTGAKVASNLLSLSPSTYSAPASEWGSEGSGLAEEGKSWPPPPPYPPPALSSAITTAPPRPPPFLRLPASALGATAGGTAAPCPAPPSSFSPRWPPLPSPRRRAPISGGAVGDPDPSDAPPPVRKAQRLSSARSSCLLSDPQEEPLYPQR